jgi:hypothetical protein
MLTSLSRITQRVKAAFIIFFLLCSSALAQYQQKAQDVRVNTASFGTNLEESDNTVQKALDRIDDMVVAGASGAWGGITGTLSDQTDLQSALDLKANLAGPHFTGNVGIATTAPRYKLEVDGSIYGQALTIDNVLYALSSGNVGVGTAAPGYKLEVDGTLYADTIYGNGTNIANVTKPTDLVSYATTASLSGYVPTSRTVNGQALTGNITIDAMIYPGAGIPLSTGSAWGTSITNNSANWNTAYGWGNHASAGYVTGTPWTGMGYLTAVASDSTWTTHNSYPSACSAGQYVLAVGDTLTCGTPTDTNTTYTATANRGLLLTDSTKFGLIETCNSGETLKWNGSAWACAADNTGSSSGTPGGSSSQIQFNNAGVLDGVDGFIYNGTNIGIGTTVPNYKLQVDGSIYGQTLYGNGANIANVTKPADLGAYLTSATASSTYVPLTRTVNSKALSSNITLTVNDIDMGIYALDTDLASYAPLANPHFTGNVGVGSSGPRYKLEVDGSLYSQGLTIDGVIYGKTNVGIGTSNPAAALDVAIGGIRLGGVTNTSWPSTSQWSGSAGSAISYNSANVGIGSSAPIYKLEVDGSVYSQGLTIDGVIYGKTNVGIGTSSPTARLEISGTSPSYFSGNVGIGTAVATSALYVIGTMRSQVLTVDNAIYTLSAGNVGIGSTTPTRTLDVAGSIEIDTYIYTSTHYCYASGTGITCAAR